jgi:hypothetical protein
VGKDEMTKKRPAVVDVGVVPERLFKQSQSNQSP